MATSSQEHIPWLRTEKGKGCAQVPAFVCVSLSGHSHFSPNFRQRVLKNPGYDFSVYHCLAKSSYYQTISHHLSKSASQRFHLKTV
jgi:hypothetical protein